MARHKARRTFEGGLRRGAAKRACVRPPQTADTYQAIYNYAGDAGGGSQTLSTSDTWRAALLGTVAAGALFFGYGRSARADCTGSGATLTCTGDITTAGNDAQGIYAYSRSGNVTVTQTGDITTDGEYSDGIFAYSYFGDVTVTQTGDITTEGNDAQATARPATLVPLTASSLPPISRQPPTVL